jgi:hypothetical protein
VTRSSLAAEPRTYSDETEVPVAPFDAVRLSVADWWPPAAPDNPS